MAKGSHRPCQVTSRAAVPVGSDFPNTPPLAQEPGGPCAMSWATVHGPWVVDGVKLCLADSSKACSCRSSNWCGAPLNRQKLILECCHICPSAELNATYHSARDIRDAVRCFSRGESLLCLVAPLPPCLAGGPGGFGSCLLVFWDGRRWGIYQLLGLSSAYFVGKLASLDIR